MFESNLDSGEAAKSLVVKRADTRKRGLDEGEVGSTKLLVNCTRPQRPEPLTNHRKLTEN